MSRGRAILLGCATSTGVPLIGCRCAVCTSSDPHNRRRRASLWFEIDGERALVDTSTDLRAQALDYGLPGVDKVLYTHTHADHVHGIDDLRMFNFMQMQSIPCYGSAATVSQLEYRFDYIFRPAANAPSSLPRLWLEEITGPIPCGGGEIVPVPIRHGREAIYGFRVGTLAYMTDISGLGEGAREALAGVRTAIIGALRHEPHPTHMTVEEAVDLAAELGVERAVLTHMSHDLDYQRLRRQLPAHVEPGYDGMVIPFSW